MDANLFLAVEARSEPLMQRSPALACLPVGGGSFSHASGGARPQMCCFLRVLTCLQKRTSPPLSLPL